MSNEPTPRPPYDDQLMDLVSQFDTLNEAVHRLDNERATIERGLKEAVAHLEAANAQREEARRALLDYLGGTLATPVNPNAATAPWSALSAFHQGDNPYTARDIDRGIAPPGFFDDKDKP